jgi:hypothetical protein
MLILKHPTNIPTTPPGSNHDQVQLRSCSTEAQQVAVLSWPWVWLTVFRHHESSIPTLVSSPRRKLVLRNQLQETTVFLSSAANWFGLGFL